MTETSFDRLRRSELVEARFASLQQTRVLLVGCGGLGSDIALKLAGCGIGKWTLVDRDSVSLENIPHSAVFCLADIGKSKVTVLADFLTSKFSDLTVVGEPWAIQQCGETVFTDCDVIVCAPDNDQTRLWVNYYGVKYKKPALFVGLGGPGDEWSGYLYFYTPSQSGCFLCFRHGGAAGDFSYAPVARTQDPDADRLACGGKNVAVPVLAPVAGMTASFAAALVIKHLLGLPTASYTLLNAKIPLLETAAFQPVPECAVCGNAREFDLATVLKTLQT